MASVEIQAEFRARALPHELAAKVLPLAHVRPDAGGLSDADWLRSRSQGELLEGSTLFHAPSFAFQSPGGGENQLVQTGRALENMGLDIRLFSPWLDQLDRARVLHLFGMSREGLELAKIARARDVPVALSTICWIEPAAMSALSGSRMGKLLNRARWTVKGFLPRMPSWRRELLQLADAILPNSEAEADQLVRWFGADRKAIRVVPNGVEERFAQADPTLFQRRHGSDPFVLFVGRVEPRKNVLGLIEAAKMANLPLVILGDPTAAHHEYALRCRIAGGDRVRWLPRVEHDDPMLASAYAAARVLALPSWFETPGLVALEAGLAGTAVVVTPYGSTPEYFRDRVEYARPGKIREIANALETAWERGAHPGLSSLIRAKYPWSEVARKTAEAYDQIAR